MKTPSITLCFSELPSSCCTQGCKKTYLRHVKISLCHKKIQECRDMSEVGKA